MTETSCYGVEFFDSGGKECPFTECIVRKECRSICESATGIIHDRLVRLKSEEISKKKIEKEVKSKNKKKIRERIFKIKKNEERKSGYTKPRRLEYKAEGCLRDEMMEYVLSFFKDTRFTVRTTRYLQSVSDNFIGPVTTRYLFKISTTRKKSILIYINNDLADRISTDKFSCRRVYEYEGLCFPNYLEWVVVIDSIPKLKSFFALVEV